MEIVVQSIITEYSEYDLHTAQIDAVMAYHNERVDNAARSLPDVPCVENDTFWRHVHRDDEWIYEVVTELEWDMTAVLRVG